MKKAVMLFTVALMLVASSAFAGVTPDFPSYWNSTSAYKSGSNGTMLYITGFGLNQTSKIKAKADGVTFMNSTKGIFVVETKNSDGGAFNGTTSFSNSTHEGGKIDYAMASAGLTLNSAIGNVNGLVTVANGAPGAEHPFNATQYFVPAGNYEVLFGLTNSSYNSSIADNDPYQNFAVGRGLSMLSVFANGSFDGVSSDSDVWSYYAYGINAINAKPMFIIGQVKITADSGVNNAQAKYYMYNGSKVDNTSSWITYNATGIDAKNSMALVREDGLTLLGNSTINADENLIVGRTGAAGGISAVNRNPLFVIMVKNGSVLTSDDIKGRAYRQVFAGSGYGEKSLGNATGGFLQYSISDAEKIDGDVALADPVKGDLISEDVDFEAASIDGYTVALADTTQFGLTQSNMTISDTNDEEDFAFYGVQNAEKTFAVGIAEYVSKDAYAMSVLIPAGASTGPIGAAGAAYQSNSSLAFHTGINLNSTGYTATSLKSTWSGLPSNFTPLSEVKGFNATFTEEQRGDLYYTFQFAFDGVGEKVSKLQLYKLFPTSDATVRSYSYADAPALTTDGAWWISTAVGDGYISEESILAPAKTYYVNYVVKDNGKYDYKSASLQIGDPVVLGTQPDSSSSSSGCVFNPAAGFGLEWLLLMLAPMVAVVRSRFK